MPVYQYQCKKCDAIFEEMQTISNMHIPIQEPCKECVDGELYIALNPILWADSFRIGITKPKGDFLERMQHIKKRTPGNNLDF